MRTDGARKRLTLDLDSEGEPIRGRIEEESGAARSFHGWLGLAAALGSVLSSRSPDRPRSRDDEGS
jgi:hypothetical protein